MSKEVGPRERQLREQREARFAARNKPNPFEDAARGRDPAPKSSVDGGPKATKPSVGPAGGVMLEGQPARQKPKPNRPPHKIIEGLKEAIAVSMGEVNPAKVTVVRVGRPKKGETRDKPWEALGISKASYYRRQAKAAKAAKGEEM